MTDPTASPLCWPAGWRRTPPHRRTAAKFREGKSGMVGSGDTSRWQSAKRVEIGEGVDRVLGELGRMGISARTIIISTDLKLRGDGLPYSTQATSKLDPGAAVYWKDGANSRCMAVDRYDRIADNLAAIAATIEAMRALERHGGAVILDRAFMGFAALPAPEEQKAPHDILGVSEHAQPGEIESAFRRLAMQAHPDRPGGSHETMARYNAARAAMLTRFGL